jgi:hypothetical protein
MTRLANCPRPPTNSDSPIPSRRWLYSRAIEVRTKCARGSVGCRHCSKRQGFSTPPSAGADRGRARGRAWRPRCHSCVRRVGGAWDDGGHPWIGKEIFEEASLVNFGTSLGRPRSAYRQWIRLELRRLPPYAETTLLAACSTSLAALSEGLSGISCARPFSSLADEPFAEDDGELGLGLEPFARRPFHSSAAFRSMPSPARTR